MTKPSGSATDGLKDFALTRRFKKISFSFGLAVALAGFGALNVFYLAGFPYQQGLPGLYDYASATIGDAIALPVMTSALVYTVLVLRPSPHERLAGVLSAAVGGAIGGATQILWLRDSDPQPNWTFPRAHHFTVAGWYHAVFLVAMCALTGALWTLAIRRLAAADTSRRRSCTRPIVMASVAGLVFLVLLALDNRSVGATSAGRATLYAAVAGALLLAITATISVGFFRARHDSD